VNKREIKIKRLHPDANIPRYATDGSSGFDLVTLENVSGPCDTIVLIRTGLSFQIPEGYELQIRPRSSTSLSGIHIPFGTIDSDYRGEIKIFAQSLFRRSIEIKKGTRIAQAILSPIVKAEFIEVESLNETKRGAGGFGSTGL
jgi:dUTP pyrophosphatase